MALQSATGTNLTDMQMEIKRLLQETHWFINMKKVSQDYEIVVKDAVQRVEGVMRRILYPKQHGDDSKEVCACTCVCVWCVCVHIRVCVCVCVSVRVEVRRRGCSAPFPTVCMYAFRCVLEQLSPHPVHINGVFRTTLCN